MRARWFALALGGSLLARGAQGWPEAEPGAGEDHRVVSVGMLGAIADAAARLRRG